MGILHGPDFLLTPVPHSLNNPLCKTWAPWHCCQHHKPCSAAKSLTKTLHGTPDLQGATILQRLPLKLHSMSHPAAAQRSLQIAAVAYQLVCKLHCTP